MPTHVPVPTPRITRINPHDNLKYAFTITTHRRGGAFHLTVLVTDPSLSINAPDPIDAATGLPVDPTRTLMLRRSRPYWRDVVKACAALVALSMWDPRLPAGVRGRSMWRTDTEAYADKTEHEETVLFALPQLLNPQRGRRTHARTEAATSVPHGTARLRRRAELAVCVTRMQALLEPVQEKLADARRMQGMPLAEVEQLRRLFDTLTVTLDTTQRVLTTEAAAARSVRTITLTPDTGPAPARTGLKLDLADFDNDPLPEPFISPDAPRFSFGHTPPEPAPFAFGTLVPRPVVDLSEFD